ncbi:MAG TPA: NepR family anti-sigma factor [Stellaceae bacterium]|nr:NepR family anti-sigma factor [Stellaceae bacterium]
MRRTVERRRNARSKALGRMNEKSKLSGGRRRGRALSEDSSTDVPRPAPKANGGRERGSAGSDGDPVLDRLKGMYDAAVEQPIPMRFLDLLGPAEEAPLPGRGNSKLN